MVTVTGFKTVITEEGDNYVRLILKGGLEMIKSVTTGNFYAHTKIASVSSTFDEATAKSMIGQQLSGSIIKQEVEPYEYEINGEVMTLKHRWVYTEKTAEELAVDSLVDEVNSSAKQNGNMQEAVSV